MEQDILKRMVLFCKAAAEVCELNDLVRDYIIYGDAWLTAIYFLLEFFYKVNQIYPYP